jgi:hypothetical protein
VSDIDYDYLPCVGELVTVESGKHDPPHLECSPHVVVSRIAWDEHATPGGGTLFRIPLFYVKHRDVPNAREFGPFTGARLRPGW